MHSIRNLLLLFTVATATWFCTSITAQGIILSLNHDAEGLGLAATDWSALTYTMLGENGTTTDGYASGVADVDCFGERFFYVLANPYRLVTLDAVTGELLSSVMIDNPLDADVPATNIAYDWTDDKLYGICHWYDQFTNVQLISIDPATGAVEPVSDGPDYGSDYGSGNSDIDALGNRYFMFGGGKLKVWDTGTGDMLLNSALPTLFGASNLESYTHPMYHPVEDKLYALHMLYPESYDFNGPLFQTELRLVRIDPATGEVEWYTPEAVSMDGIQSGLCDIDPFNNRIFYHRVGQLVCLNTEDGSGIGAASEPDMSISPWANLQYHDLSTPPTASVGAEAEATVIPWDGASLLTLPHGLGSAVEFEGWTGAGGVSSDAEFWTVEEFGTLHVSATRTGASGETVTVERTFQIVPEEVTNDIADFEDRNACRFYPNPVRAGAAVDSPLGVSGLARWWNANGSLVLGGTKTAPQQQGLYTVTAPGCPAQRVVVQ